MREWIFWLVVTFHTTAAAMAMEALCKEQSLPGRLIPTPRELTADCGMAWRAPPETGKSLRALAGARRLDWAGWGTFFILQEICGELVRFWQSGQMPATTSRWPSTR